MRSPLAFSVLSCAILFATAGCRMGVPLHVWQPPEMQSAVGKRLVISSVGGPDELAEKVQQKMLALAPRDTGRNVDVASAASLPQVGNIRLVSATDDEPNDLALTSMGRHAGIDYLLRGEILVDRHPKSAAANSEEKLLISWRLTPIGSQQRPEGRPVVVDLESALKRYPDLSMLGDPTDVLTSAAVRDTYRLITPSIERERVQLAIPYLMPGSAEVRRGNMSALAGKWQEAKQTWTEAMEGHPTQAAAVHNLAIAAAAEQDFSRAKELARKAIRMQPTKLHQETLVWIELKQRDYHESFQLADPPEGWFVTSEQPPS
ncbi:MAG: hypothetical protein AB8B91_16845 [Rubripirellula sp.]